MGMGTGLRVLALLCFSLAVKGQTNYESIICPFPGGDSENNQVECSLYTACTWSGTTCHMKVNSQVGYKINGPVTDTGRGFSVPLVRIAQSDTLFFGDIENLIFEAIYHEDYHLQVKITDADNSRYEVPVPLNLPASAGSSPLYDIKLRSEVLGDEFAFNITRVSNGNIIYKSAGGLTFEDQFIQFTTKLSSTYLYGFGEATHTIFRHDFTQRTTCAMFSRDLPVQTSLANEYGTHPHYTVIEDAEGNTHSVLFFNSNAMEYSTFTMDDGSPALTLRTIGGIVDLHFFLGPSFLDVTSQYTNMVGRAAFPPYFNFGFHISRWGYTSTNHVRAVRQRMKDNQIPQDVQTLDIDYMENYRDFTTDPVNWADITDLVNELHADGLKVTIILDPAIEIDLDNYPPFVRGRNADAYIKWQKPEFIPGNQPVGGDNYVVGNVWPLGPTVFPDFFKPEAQQWWKDEIILFKNNEVDFDALWIDMNEPACFSTDVGGQLNCPYTKLDSPPFPTATTYLGNSESNRISDHSICMSSNQTDGNVTYSHYDVHSLYGWSNALPSYEAMQDLFPGQRPTLLSRSTYPGSGQYAVHWLGDNTANYEQMAMSIVGMMEFNMFGLSFVGADVCGFFADSTDELCTRWTELGAFYPFNRNHNADGYADQDPGMFPTTTVVARDIYLQRYKYNPYLYTLHYDSATIGLTAIRPIFTIDITDLPARDIQDQFMWGDGIMVAPVLIEGKRDRDVYFPDSLWYDFFTGELQSTGPETQTAIPVALEEILVYVRGGVILPFQEPALTTSLSRLNSFGVTIALDSSGSATGKLFWDDGAAVLDVPNSYIAQFTYDAGVFDMTVSGSVASVSGLNMGTVNIYGYSSDPTSVNVNGSPLNSTSWNYDAAISVLVLTISELMDGNINIVII